MNKKQLRFVLKDLAEKRAPAAQIDLWPEIQSRVQMSQSTPSRGTIMNTHTNPQGWHQRRLLKPASILAAVLLIVALFFAFPQGRALGQQIIHFFNRGESNIMPGAVATPIKWVEQTPGVAAATSTPLPPQPTQPGPALEKDCGAFANPHCSIEEIRKLVDFPVFAPPELPEGLVFQGATGSPDQVHLFYTTPNQTGNLIIWEEPFTGAENQVAWEVGADAEIQSVQVGAVTAEYVKGVYDGTNGTPIWNADADHQTLRWVNQDVLINLIMLGAEPRLDRDDLAALAATLTGGPVGQSGLPSVEGAPPTAAPTDDYPDLREIFPLTLAEAEEQAGFALLTPSRLPENLTFFGVQYDEATKVVKINYIYHHPTNPEAQGGLLVSMQHAPEGVDCDLCGFVQGNGKQVEQYPVGKLISEDATVETLPINNDEIGEITGQYVEGIGWTSRTEATGWQWDSYPFRKRLRFRAGDLAVEIWADVYDLSKEDFISIVESLE